MDIKVTDTTISIHESWSYTKRQMKESLDYLYDRYPDNTLLQKRSKRSLLYEWAFHSFCFRMGWFVERTETVDFNYPLSWYENLIYPVFGWLSLLFIG